MHDPYYVPYNHALTGMRGHIGTSLLTIKVSILSLRLNQVIERKRCSKVNSE